MLELASNTIKVIGIFGRLIPEQEVFLDSIELKYSRKPDPSAGFDIFRHLTLTYIPNATVHDLSEQLDLLKDLKPFLPVRLPVRKFFVKEEVSWEGAEHIAAEFGSEHTEKLRAFIARNIGNDKAVTTSYMKSVWFVPKEHQEKVMQELRGFKELVYGDFYLVCNKQDEANTVYTTNRFFL